MTGAEPAPRPLDPPPPTGDARLDALARLLAIVDRLREPDGCPWDREQSVASMGSSLTEEAFEALEAIDRGDDPGTVEELGDLLMVIALVARIASEAERFDIATLAERVSDKLIRRHPHVFGDAQVTGSEAVLQNWERIKQAERAEREEDTSALAGVPVALPALQRADRLASKAISAGFRWSDQQGAFAKLREEVAELEAELTRPEPDRSRVEAELGDVLLAAAFLGRYLKIDPEATTRAAARRFETRFRSMEGELDGELRGHSLDALMAAWGRAKQRTAD